MQYNFKYLLVSFISLISINIPQLCLANELDSAIVKFFKERIVDFRNNTLVSFDEKRTLKIEECKDAEARIWSLWKNVNADFSEFKNKIYRTPKTFEDYPIQVWEMYKEDPMPFYFVKKGNKPAEGYPLFLNLHGSGPKFDEFRSTLAWSLQYKDSPSAYFIPQIPNERRYRWWFQAHQFAWEKFFRIAMIDTSINANKVYLTGISEGGYGSQRLGAFYADYIAGAGPMAGGEPLRNAPASNFRNIAFSLQTGELDHSFGRNKLSIIAKNTFDSLAKMNPNEFRHRIELQKGLGHGIDYSVTTPWLLGFERNPQPKHITWVNFPMDGRYRHGFYNIGINRLLNVKEGETFDRAVFTMKADREKNIVEVTILRTSPEGDQYSNDLEGQITIYLSDILVDLKKKVRVNYNGKNIFYGRVDLSESVMVESCALFGDPSRLFPAKVTITL